VAFQNFEEVWAALGRLYSDIVKLQESQQRLLESQQRLLESQQENASQIGRVIEGLDRLTEGHERLNSMLATLAGHVTELTRSVESHERRLARMEGQ
jgi:predicted nuclease with TOPRIM domain